MENFYLILECIKNKFRVYLNQSNYELTKKFTEINRNETLKKKFILVIEAVKVKAANKSQYNLEGSFPIGSVYAIKVDQHRLYTLQRSSNDGYRELFIYRHAKKETQKNDKKLNDTIDTIKKIEIEIVKL